MTTKILMPRECTSCGRGMAEGATIDDGLEYYCSNICLHTKYTQEEFDELYDDGEGTSYFTDWEEEDADPDDQPEEMSAFTYGKFAFQAGAPKIPGLDHEFCRSLERAPIAEELKPLEQWIEGWVSGELEASFNLAPRNHIADVNYYIEEKGMSYEEAMAKVQLERFEEEHTPKATDFI